MMIPKTMFVIAVQALAAAATWYRDLLGMREFAVCTLDGHRLVNRQE